MFFKQTPEKLHLIILYEDSERTMKFLQQLSHAPFFNTIHIDLVDTGTNSGIVRSPDQSSNNLHCKCVVFSRCSGSYLSRNHEHSPLMIESVLVAAENDTSNCRVFNGSNAFRIEMNKMLPNIVIDSEKFKNQCMKRSLTRKVHVVVPTTVAITNLEPKLIETAVLKHNITSECFVKGIVGGGSTAVKQLSIPQKWTTNDRKQIQKMKSDFDNMGLAKNICILQSLSHIDERYANVQYRFEIINQKVYYIVKIVKTEVSNPLNTSQSNGSSLVKTVPNLCMCDIDDDDSFVSLSLIKTVEDLSKESVVYGGTQSSLTNAKEIVNHAEEYAKSQNLHVVALEGTICNGIFSVFDINTNSNYNYALEMKNNMYPAAWHVVKTMFSREL